MSDNTCQSHIYNTLKTTEPELVGQCESPNINVITHAPTSTVMQHPSKSHPLCQKLLNQYWLVSVSLQALNVTTHAPTSSVTRPSEQFNPSPFILDDDDDDDDDDDAFLLSADMIENQNAPSKPQIQKNKKHKTICLRLRLLAHPQRLLQVVLTLKNKTETYENHNMSSKDNRPKSDGLCNIS